MAKVVSQRALGLVQTYDLEVDHPDHQYYLSNGLLTSNSHAVSYAIDSFQCATLLTKYEPEWLCAYAETYAGDNEKRRARAIGEIKALGYDIVKPDINYADRTWTIMGGNKFMPSFLMCKGIGLAAVSELIINRPFNTVYDLFWDTAGNWRHSKLNKRCMEALIKIGAFESMKIVGSDSYFASYRHMHACVIENWAAIRKKGGKQLLDELAASGREMGEWSREDRVAMYLELMGDVDIDLIISTVIRQKMAARGIQSIDSAIEGAKNMHWLIVRDTKPKKTKNGKPYLMATVQGESGKLHKLFIWGWKPDDVIIKPNYAYLAEIERNDFGMSTQVWKLREFE